MAQKDWKQYLALGKEQKPGPALVLSQPLPTAPQLWPYQLQEVMVPMVGNRVCNQRYQSSSTNTGQIIQDDMLCAGSQGLDSSQGDSGGPWCAAGKAPGSR
ncbi:Mastin [Myotis davidii]|uniref:Mastin n=1 Tax=Myotis davidii TaxID=225400 RepID=L5M6E4_MYODS|nr:Mastin [Myotis davidii]